MADFSLEEFESLTRSGGAQPAPIALPQTTNAVFDVGEFNNLIGDTTAQNLPPTTVTATPQFTPAERFGRRTEEGEPIPFDVRRGLGDRLATWRVAQQSGDEAKLQVLQEMYPDSQPRILPTGDLTVTLNDSETGKKKEILIDPDGIGETELIELASQMPEIAAGTAAAIATRGTGIRKTVAQIVLSAFSASGAGAIKDIANRAVEPGVDINIGEISRRRSTEAALDMFLSTALLGVGKSFRALSPFARDIKPGTKEFDVVKGQQFFKDSFGEDIKLTPAEVTGSKALSALEAAEAPQPGSRTVMSKFREKTNESMERIQKRATGELTAEEEIGETGIGVIRQELVEPLERALAQTRETALAKGDKRIADLIDDSIGMRAGAEISETEAGTTALSQFDKKLAEAKVKVDAAYAEVNKIPGGTGDVLDGSFAAKEAQAIRSELPRSVSGSKSEVLTSGVESAVLKSLDDLESLAGKKVSLQTLTKMRRAAFDEIAKTEAVPGVQDRWFKKIAAAYDKGAQDGIDAIGRPDLKAALTNAKNVYKKELLPFDRPGLKELAKDEMDAGRLSPMQVFNRFFEGPKAVENFRMLKEVLGSGDPSFRILKRAWADQKLRSVTDPITKSIKPRELQLIIDNLPKEMREELFGRNADKLSAALNVQSGIKNLKSLDEANIRALLSIKDPSVDDLKSVIKMQGIVDTAYVNSFLADIADGLPIASKLKPTEFVKKLLNTSTPTKDVRLVLDTIAKESPKTREAIANHTFYQLLDAASFREADTAGKLISGQPLNLSPIKLADALGRPGTAQRNRYELLLGQDKLPIAPPVMAGGKTVDTNPTRLEVLENVVKTLAPREGREKAFASAGQLSSGAIIQNLFKDPLRYAGMYAKKAALTALYLGPLSKLTANRTFTGPELAAVANTMIASEPFVSRVMEVAGDETMAGAIIQDLKQSIDRFVDEWMQSPEGRESERTAEFLGGRNVPMKVQGQR